MTWNNEYESEYESVSRISIWINFHKDCNLLNFSITQEESIDKIYTKRKCSSMFENFENRKTRPWIIRKLLGSGPSFHTVLSAFQTSTCKLSKLSGSISKPSTTSNYKYKNLMNLIRWSSWEKLLGKLS